MNDPLYQAIEAGLGKRLDHEVFEQCAQDLLRSDYPRMVPVRGGTDSGMDGAIADGKGYPLPLICTTAKAVQTNLIKNLKSYIEHGGTRRRAVLVTSQALLPAERKKLEAAAAKRGFILIQIHERADMTNRLYRSPKWCKTLLHLNGAPPPLSRLPISRRPIVDQPIIGREKDMEWLRVTSSDIVLSGQPGSGKTFLMYLLAKENEGLFVISDKREEIANGIREQQPKALLVDDAHLHLELITSLRQLRTEISADFRIVANCWPGEEERLRIALDAPSSSVHQLEKLSRDNILLIVKACGVLGPLDLQREIVSQAAGLPGLAVTLSRLWMRGDGHEIALADALARDVCTTFEDLVGKEATHVLASFAVGGDKGMAMADVARCLGFPLAKVQSITAQLATGGVLLAGEQTLSVRPSALRHALVRDTFFAGALSMPIEPLLTCAKSLPDAISTVIHARSRGAVVSDSFIQELLEKTSITEPWHEFARFGPEQCRWIMENHPDKSMSIVDPALHHYPEGMVPILLDKAVDDNRPLNAHPDHSLRKFTDWVERAVPGTDEVMRRRNGILDAALKWSSAGGNATVALKAMAASLSPGYNYSDSDAGSGRSFTFGSSCVTERDVREIVSNWPRILAFLESQQPKEWQPIVSVIEDYVFRHHAISGGTLEASNAMQEEGMKMLNDIVKIANGRQGVLHRAKQTAMRVKKKLTVKLDPEFAVLFPLNEDRFLIDTEAEKATKKARKLGETWSSMDPHAVVAKYAAFHIEAEQYDCWPRLGENAFAEIAARTTVPNDWIKELRAHPSTASMVHAFLLRTIALGGPATTTALLECIQQKETRYVAIQIVLKMQDPPDELLNATFANLERMEQTVEFLAIRREIPEKQLRLLLTHKDDEIASAAAVGEWYSEIKGEITPSIESEWKQAIIRAHRRHHQLHDLLKDRPDIAQAWLERTLKDKRHDYDSREMAKDAVQALSKGQRKHLLKTIPPKLWWDSILRRVVGPDKDLYKIVLSNPAFEHCHLAPLKGHPAGSWIDLAVMALDAGYNPEDIANSTRAGNMGWSGDASVMWQGWIDDYNELKEHTDLRVRKIGEAGYEVAKLYQNEALKREHHDLVYGIG